MKKTILIAVAGVVAALTASAQQPDSAKLIVRYKFSHVRDTTKRDKPYTENMILFAGQNASVYKSYDRNVQNALMHKQIDDQVAAQKGSDHITFNIKSTVPTTSTEYYQFPAQNKLIIKERLITPYLIEDGMPVINWTIAGDTMTIGGVHCQKANGHFKGRDYTAWFSPDIPFRTGPWKLNGLPGLILEAYDQNKEVMFKFDSMEEATPQIKAVATETPGPPIKMFGLDDGADPNIIAVPADAVKTTQKEFDKLREAMRKDPQGFSRSVMNGGGGGGAPVSDGPGRGPVRSMNIISVGGGAQVINNPIELPEKP